MTVPNDARADGHDLLHALAAALPRRWEVTVGRMFSGQGLSVDGKFFAFVNKGGLLVVKLSERDVHRLVDDGQAERVTMGSRTMREWVSLPQPQDGDLGRWNAAARAAYAFAREARAHEN